MLAARPLYDNSADSPFFVRPPEWDILMRAIDRRNNVLLSAARGWGKTTLLRQAQQAYRNEGKRVAFVDGTAVDDASELLARVRRALRGGRSAPEEVRNQFQALGTVLAGDPDPPPAGASYALMNELREIEALPETVILLDGSHSAVAIYWVFGRLRDAIWQLPHQWVVAVDKDDEPTVLKPPADAFFDLVLRVQPWTAEDLVRVLDKRLQDNDLDRADVREIATASNGTPRAAAVLVGDGEATLLTRRETVEELLAREV